MSGLLEALLGEDTDTIEDVRANTGGDRKRAQQAYGAAVEASAAPSATIQTYTAARDRVCQDAVTTAAPLKARSARA